MCVWRDTLKMCSCLLIVGAFVSHLKKKKRNQSKTLHVKYSASVYSDRFCHSGWFLLSLVQPASVTATQTSAASAWRCFSSRVGVAEACVRSVATTRPGATASTARADTPATTASRWTTARPANVSHWSVFVCVLRDEKRILAFMPACLKERKHTKKCKVYESVYGVVKLWEWTAIPVGDTLTKKNPVTYPTELPPVSPIVYRRLASAATPDLWLVTCPVTLWHADVEAQPRA